jgi:hypothetical protein
MQEYIDVFRKMALMLDIPLHTLRNAYEVYMRFTYTYSKYYIHVWTN